MKTTLLCLSLLLLPLSAFVMGACDKQEDDNQDTTTTVAEQPDMNADDGALKWYTTCGDPVCSGYSGPYDGVPACGAIKEGDACETAGETCDFMSDCNARLICASEDPKQQVGGCPISRTRFKQDINYIDLAQREAYYRELLELRLATYRYRARQDGKTQLGVILEDDEQAVWADPANDRVDLYNYASLAVAGVQTQAAELATMQAKLDALEAEMQLLREQAKACR